MIQNKNRKQGCRSYFCHRQGLVVPNLATRKRLEKWQGGQAGVVVAAGTRTQQHLDTTTGGDTARRQLVL